MRGFTGSWLWTGRDDLPPMAAGAVVVDARGTVVATGVAAELRALHRGVAFEQLDAVLMPGLVNAHTHLELSALRGLVAGGRGFVPWLDELLRVRGERQPEEDSEAIDNAVSELLAAGVAAVGEVSNRLHTVAALASVPLLACVFHEVFGPRRESAEAALGFVDKERAEYPGFPAHVRYAVAPHTPYTLHPAYLQQIVARAAHSGTRTSLHLAEHAAERAWLTTGQGPFGEWVAARKADRDWPPPECDAVRYADKLGVLGPSVLLVHLTDARPDELAIVAERKCAVVLCPRSNLHIELKLPPLLDILRAGIRPGLGTDSLASNKNLDPLAEARALHQRFPTVPPLTLLAMATSWGAEALGVGERIGTLEPGKAPGLIAFQHGPATPEDPARFVLENERAARRVLVRPQPLELATVEVPV